MLKRDETRLNLMSQVEIAIGKITYSNDLLFPLGIWLLSRIVIWIAMLIIAPNLPVPHYGVVPKFGWGIFDAWDSIHYRAIATSGYEFVDDGNRHNLAFFPLFPLVLRGLMDAGLPFQVAGTLANNLAFLAALCILYLWSKKNYGKNAARWVCAVMAWCPMSMFGSMIYTEGFYLLFSTAALYAFDQKYYGWTALCGAMATATRPTGMALIPAFLLVSLKERRPLIAYVASFSTAIGVLIFSLYCALNFGHPLAFIQAQRGWRPSLGFDWQGWINMLIQIAVGRTNWQYGAIKDFVHPILFCVFVGGGYRIWNFRKHFTSLRVVYGFYGLVAFLLIFASGYWINNLLNAVIFIGGGYMLWQLRTQLTLVTLTYGFCGIALLLASGGTMSLSRLAYGIVPLSVALGVFLSHYPRRGYLILGLSGILLARVAVMFAQQLWVA
jgi:Gpi18-like mannosyltransferase